MNNKLNKNEEFEEKGLTDVESIDSLNDPFEQPNNIKKIRLDLASEPKGILTPVMS